MSTFPLAAYGLVGDFAYGPAAPYIHRPATFAGNVNKDVDIGGTYVERVTAVSFTLVNGADVGSRYASVAFLDESGVALAQAVAPFATAATITTRYTFAVGAQQGGAANLAAITTALPAIFLQATYKVRLSVVGGFAADAVSAVRVLTDRFSTDPSLYAPGIGSEPE